MKCKGAILTWDFLFALLIFTVILISLIFLWGKVKSDMKTSSVRMDKREKALRISDLIVAGRGLPHYWYVLNITSDDVDAVGLSGKDHVLRRQKLRALELANYTEMKTIFGLGREDFNITITRDWDSTPVVEYSVGRNNLNASDSLVIRRIAVLDKYPVEVLVRLTYEVN